MVAVRRAGRAPGGASPPSRSCRRRRRAPPPEHGQVVEQADVGRPLPRGPPPGHPLEPPRQAAGVAHQRDPLPGISEPARLLQRQPGLAAAGAADDLEPPEVPESVHVRLVPGHQLHTLLVLRRGGQQARLPGQSHGQHVDEAVQDLSGQDGHAPAVLLQPATYGGSSSPAAYLIAVEQNAPGALRRRPGGRHTGPGKRNHGRRARRPQVAGLPREVAHQRVPRVPGLLERVPHLVARLRPPPVPARHLPALDLDDRDASARPQHHDVGLALARAVHEGQRVQQYGVVRQPVPQRLPHGPLGLVAGLPQRRVGQAAGRHGADSAGRSGSCGDCSGPRQCRTCRQQWRSGSRWGWCTWRTQIWHGRT